MRGIPIPSWLRGSARSMPMIALVLLAVMCPPAQGEMIDGIVAVVDDTVIMYSDVTKKMAELGAKEFDRSSARQVLQIMIEDAVVSKVYRQMGMQPVDLRHAEQVAREMNIDVASARSMIMKTTLMELMVKSRVVITESMIRDYHALSKAYAGTESVHLKQILIKGDAEKARKAMGEITSGRTFDEVAGTYSDLLISGSADIGWVAVSDLAPEARKAIESAGKGGVAGPVEIGDSILIFQVVEQGTSGGKPIEEVKEEIVQALQDKYRKEAFEHWLNMIMADHYIGVYL